MKGGLVIALAACGGHANVGIDSNHNGGRSLKPNLGVDVGQVAGFALAPAVGSHLREKPDAPTSSSNTLYAIGGDGALTVVTVIQSDDPMIDAGTATSTTYPVAIFDTPKLTFFPYEGFSCTAVVGGDNSSVIALRKSDGALFCVPDLATFTSRFTDPPTLVGPQGLGAYFPQIQADATGDIVWVNSGPPSVVSFADPANPTVTQPFDMSVGGPATPGGGGFAVDADGDMLYAGGAQNTTTIRVQKVAGGFVNAGTTNATCVTIGPASNPNDFYYIDHNNPQQVVEISKAASFVPAPVLSTGSTSSSTYDCGAGLGKANGHLFFTQNPLFAMGATANQLLDFVATPPSITPITVAALATIQRIIANGTQLVILGHDSLGNGGIVRYDTVGATFTTVLVPGAYTINSTAFSVATNGDLTFQGQRASDGAFVLGTVAAGTTTVNVTATGVPQAIQIQRIN